MCTQGEYHVKTEVMLPGQGATRSQKEELKQVHQRELGPANTLTLCFCVPEMSDNIFIVLSHPDFGILLQQLQETNTTVFSIVLQTVALLTHLHSMSPTKYN